MTCSAPCLTVGVMITTRNRAVDLRRTLEQLRQLDPAPDEILITADACSDDTVAIARELLPAVRLHINDQPAGSVANRDRMMRTATTDLVLSLDDDSYPEQSNAVAVLRELFATRPCIAVAHFPQHSDEYPESLTQAEFGPERLTGSFANSGACLLRIAYLSLPGFSPRFFHMYEEPDYALQCVGAGWQVVFYPKLAIRHHYSGRGRNELKIHALHARNEFWSAWMRCPFPYVLAVSLFRVFSQARYAAGRGFRWLIREPLWWWVALSGLPDCFRERRPIAWSCYYKWLRLLRKPEVLREQ